MMTYIIILSMIIMFLLLLVQLLLSSFSLNSDFQYSSLESGFEMLKYGAFISSSFFFLAVLFVFFDMEVILALPCMIFKNFPSTMFLVVLFFITSSLMLEWFISGLKWTS